MLDKAVFHIPVDASLVDVREDGKYCIFGFDLLDLDLRIASHSVYKDEDGNVTQNNSMLNTWLRCKKQKGKV